MLRSSFVVKPGLFHGATMNDTAYIPGTDEIVKMIRHCKDVPWEQVDHVAMFRVKEHIGNLMSIGPLTHSSLEHQPGAVPLYKWWEARYTNQTCVTQPEVRCKVQGIHYTMSTLRYLLQIM